MNILRAIRPRLRTSIHSTPRNVARSRHDEARTRGQLENRNGRFIGGLVSGVLATAAVVYTLNWSATLKNDSQNHITTTGLTPDDRSTQPLATSPPIHHDTSPANIAAAHQEFLALLGPSHISTHPSDLRSHSSTEWSPSPDPSLTASLILFPTSTSDVSAIMRICHRRSIPVTPYSGGTSLDGALATTRPGGVCLDFRHMDRILAVHAADLDAVVQPAVGWQDLNAVLEPQGLFFPVDPGPGAQIGGMIATGCSGTNAYRYGPMRDWVVSLTLVLADGTVVRTRRRPRKSTAGYDLGRLMVSSSGTLGVVTEAVVKVTAWPRNVGVALVGFGRVGDAVGAVVEMIQAGLQTEALELVDGFGMRATNLGGYTQKEYEEVPTLFIKFAGADRESVERQVRQVRELVARHGSRSFEASNEAEEMDAIWSARKTWLWSFLALKKRPEDEFLSADIAVPISKLGVIIDECEEVLKRDGLLGSSMGHVGDGNFHLSVLYGKQEKEKAEKVILWARRRAIELEGTVTGEHGVGLALRDVLQEEVGQDAIDMMRRIKLALDPKCLLACDKVIRMDNDPSH